MVDARRVPRLSIQRAEQARLRQPRSCRLMEMTDRYALMWSGGKDSALALDRASRSGIEVDRLLSFYDSATRRVRFHATRVEMLEAQTAAIGIELRAVPTSWQEMEANLRVQLSSLREEGFKGVVMAAIH